MNTARALVFGLGFGLAAPVRAQEAIEAHDARPTPVLNAMESIDGSLQNLERTMKAMGLALGVGSLLGGGALAWAARRKDAQFLANLKALEQQNP